MKKIEELKFALIDDLKVCISYEPNKEHDLLHMMECYLKSEIRRKELHPEIKHLLNGEPYKNPFETHYPYTEKDIEALNNILSSYISDMRSSDYPEQTLCNTITQIGELHEQCRGELIDDWRTVRLEKLLISVAQLQHYYTATTVIESRKRW